MVRDFGVRGEPGRMLGVLAELNGDDALERAGRELAGADTAVLDALGYLSSLAEQMRRVMPRVPVHFDLAELRGYHYKTGVVFAAFVPGSGQEVARGGRYDDIGQVFGRARPAVGFSTDLKTLLQLGRNLAVRYPQGPTVAAPWSEDSDLVRKVDALRGAGRRVLMLLPGQPGGALAMGCAEQLVQHQGVWELEAVEHA